MKRLEDNNSKKRILNAAVKLFAQKGFDATSTREICKEAGVNLCMISYYFGGKQELYGAIIEDMIEKQTKYISETFDLNQNVKSLSEQAKIDLLLDFINRSVDFFYSTVTSDLVVFLVKVQQTQGFIGKSPAFDFLRNLIASIFNKAPDDKEIIFKTLFILAQINCSRVFPAFSLGLLGQDEFTVDDILRIKKNVKDYIMMLLKEEKLV